jgi:tripartite-type tricarboxylate transporter receptor subunit TctC
MDMKRMIRMVFSGLLAGLLLDLLGAPLIAADYPSKPVTMLIPYKPGGVSDIMGRIFSDVARKYFSQPIVIENRDGASGTRAIYDLVNAKPDGYTMAYMSSSEGASSLHILPAKYTLDDYTILGRAGTMPVTISTAMSWNTLQEFIDYAKKNPGKVKAGVPGLGTVVRLTGELFAKQVGLALKIVPFQGSGPLIPATLGKHVEIGFLNVPEIVPQYKAGGLKVLCVMSEERSPAIPDVRTARELGHDVVGGASHFIVVPNGVPEGIQKILRPMVEKVIRDEDFQKRAKDLGYTASYSDPTKSKTLLKDWYNKSGQLYTELEMKKK